MNVQLILTLVILVAMIVGFLSGKFKLGLVAMTAATLLCLTGVLTFDEACEFTGHAPGGVCSFALAENVKTYLDVSLKRFDTVFPAAGSANSAIEMTCDELEKYSSNFVAWVDVCKEKAPAPQA